MSTAEDAFVNDILRSHREKVEKITQQEHKQAMRKIAQERMKSKLYSAQAKPEATNPLRRLPVKNSHKAHSKPYHRQSPKTAPKPKVPPKPIPQKRPPEKPKEPLAPAKKKKLTPEEIEEQKRIKELTAIYYQNISAGMPKELEELLRKREARKEEEEEFTILDWKTNKPIKKVKESKDKKPIAPKPIDPPKALPPKPAPPIKPREELKKVPKPAPMPPKVAPISRYNAPRGLPPPRIMRPPPIRREEEEEDLSDSFIEKDDEYDPLAYRELQRIKNTYRRGFDYGQDDGDIPEATFDMITREEHRSALIGRKEDELEELREQRRKPFR